MPPNDAPILVDCSWIEEGVLLAGSIPTCEEDILFLHGLGVRSILSLTEESLGSYGISPEFLAGLGIGIAHHSIPDTEPPTRAQLAALLGDLARLKETSPALYLHCHAGFGRTGTVLHLHYLNSGLRLAEARSRIAAKRPGCAAVTERQTRFLWQYEADCLKERQRPLGPGAAIPQAAALPFRWEVSGLRVLVITSSSGNSWVVPKGHVEIRETPLETACKEAEEEAGVRGTPGPEP
ncbi:MAG: NUDIX domain-containing protein, partial [Victivallales bacterium]|nr:NUDIX domain-containing protein [Victivallales bacterium]